LPFLRFEDNVAHCQRRHALNLGGGAPFGPPNVAGVGPDARHPFVIKNMSIWNVHWAFHPVAPSVMVDGMDIHNAEYALWRPVYRAHAYRNVRLDQVTVHQEFAATGTRPRAEDFPLPLDLGGRPAAGHCHHARALGHRWHGPGARHHER
jgi:hypothetical protein